MDFLDPKKQRRHTIQLMVGYVLVAIAILISTYLIFEVVYNGIGRGKDGEIVQNGLLYISSAPSGGSIYVNGKDSKARTNTRVSLVSGQYDLKIAKAGYRDWSRTIQLDGGSVAHYDYPFLIPTKLTTTSVKSYDGAPGLVTQSPDQRWLVVQHPDGSGVFDIYDQDNPKTPAVTNSLPVGVANTGTTQSWQLVEWSTDNDHLLLKHTYDSKTEFIMMDRGDSTKSINLNQQLDISPTKLTLRDKKYDQYYVYDQTAQTLQTVSLGQPTPQAYLEHVLDYQSYGSDIMLYASSAASSASKVSIDLLQSGKTYNLREVAAGTTYLLNLTKYSGAWYVGLGASSESKIYVYKNPVTQLNSKLGVLVPTAILKTPSPTYLSFSDNAQFIMSENGSQFSTYDAETNTSYSYDSKLPVDAPQAHATWMDGDRLTYISGGKLVMFDYDHANPQTLQAASPNYLPFFSSNFKTVDTLSIPNPNGQTTLSSTALRIPADQ
jgi:hypothetical protein